MPSYIQNSTLYGPNPVRADMVRRAVDHPWSSARVHSGLTACPPWLAMQPWAAAYRPSEWEDILTIGFRDHGQLERLRDALRSGRPVGDSAFVDELEAKLGRPLRPQGTGRPAKATREIEQVNTERLRTKPASG